MLGNREFFRERMCIVGIAVSVLLTTLQTAQSTDRLPRDADLSTFPIEELDRRLDSAPRTHWDKDYDRCVPYGSILGEMIRRGGKSAELQLSRRLVDQDRQLENRRKQIAILPKDSDELSALERTASSLENNLELLTAIRRLKKQPDPLAVIVDRAGELKGGTRESPVFEVTLKNVDVQQRSFGFTHGGDYRSGRHERWRIHVWDSEGKLLPERPRWSGTAGGISNDCPLKFGETWECELPLESYVQIRTPGRYRVQVLYHNESTISDIAGEAELEHLVVIRSDVFELIVEHGPKITIHMLAESKDRAAKLVRALNEKDPLRILIGPYGKDEHVFISPDSPQGQLLEMQWQAVPSLIEALSDENMSFRKRAWIISLLFSITLERDFNPMKDSDEFFDERGLLPDYESRGSLISQVRWKSGYSLGWSDGGRSRAVRQDPDAQKAFGKTWLRFRDEYFDVHEK